MNYQIAFRIASAIALMTVSYGFSSESAQISIAGGVAKFFSSKQSQWGNNSGWSGAIEALTLKHFPMGIDASVSYDLCPVCDNTGGETMATLSVIGGIRRNLSRHFYWQAMIGPGYSWGVDKVKPVNEPVRGDSFNGISLKSKARLSVKVTRSISFGFEAFSELSPGNSNWGMRVPISIGTIGT